MEPVHGKNCWIAGWGKVEAAKRSDRPGVLREAGLNIFTEVIPHFYHDLPNFYQLFMKTLLGGFWIIFGSRNNFSNDELHTILNNH